MILHSYDKKPSPIADNWVNHEIGDQMIFSHRITEYTQETFPESFHFHDYYEIVIYIDGTIRYICDNKTLLPETGDIILATPSALHTSMLIASSRYERYVFYLYPTAFNAFYGSSLMAFLTNSCQPHIYLKKEERRHMLDLLIKIEEAFKDAQEGSTALALSYVLQLFYLLNYYSNDSSKKDPLFHAGVMNIKKYIDENFSQIYSTTQIAEAFFYSREHVSRLFQRYLNCSVKDYLNKRRILWAKEQLKTTLSINDICYQAGFRSMSSFISIFTSLTGVTPSRYRQMACKYGDAAFPLKQADG